MWFVPLKECTIPHLEGVLISTWLFKYTSQQLTLGNTDEVYLHWQSVFPLRASVVKVVERWISGEPIVWNSKSAREFRICSFSFQFTWYCHSSSYRSRRSDARQLLINTDDPEEKKKEGRNCDVKCTNCSWNVRSFLSCYRHYTCIAKPNASR